MFGLCKQASLLFVIATLSILVSIILGGKMHAIIAEIVVAGLLILAINMLCKSGYKTLAWILMYIPTFGYFFLLMIMLSVAVKNMKKTNDDKHDEHNK